MTRDMTNKQQENDTLSFYRDMLRNSWKARRAWQADGRSTQVAMLDEQISALIGFIRELEPKRSGFSETAQAAFGFVEEVRMEPKNDNIKKWWR